MKCVLWGYPLHTDTYSYVHEGFKKALERSGHKVYWFHDKEYPDEPGTIISKDEHGDVNAYRIFTPFGKLEYFSKEYIEKDCEVISEGSR